MTPQIILTLAILAVSTLLFVSERLRVDLIALLVLGSLAIFGLVTPAQALSGFSNPAVVTVWAVFILSAGLARTGVANVIGRQVLRLAGKGEMRLLAMIMLTAAIMSAFMNNVGVAALLLPVVMEIARHTGRSPSRLLMPLASGALLGGLTTLIGTPPNIITTEALRDAGLAPFGLFDFAPVGAIIMLGGIAFTVLIGRRLLPQRDTRQAMGAGNDVDPAETYALADRLFVLTLPPHTPLQGKTLLESRIGTALGLNVVGIMRNGETQLTLQPHTELRGGDQLLVAGKEERLAALQERPYLAMQDEPVSMESLTSPEVHLAEITLSSDAAIVGQTLQQMDFRGRFGANVLAIRQDDVIRRTDLQDVPLRPGDRLLVQGTEEQVATLHQASDFIFSDALDADIYHLQERLVALDIPSASSLVGQTLLESHLGDAFDLSVLGIVRGGRTRLMPEPSTRLEADDKLLVEGKAEDLAMLRALQGLEIDEETRPSLEALESAQAGMVEVVLSPHTSLAGKTLRQLHFRDKYQLNVLAIWRGGRAYRTNLRDMELRFGDALLLLGPWDRLRLLADTADFIVLAEELQETPRLEKAPLAALLMAGVVVAALTNWLPIAIAAVVGATLMVLTGCLSMEEAYRHIQWRAVFLIAGMLPLGVAMETTGAARFIAELVVGSVGGMGALALLAALFLLTTVASQIMPNAVVAVLMAPIAIKTAADMGLSPHALVMTVAIAASASFLSPVAHPANVLVMGPGGYRFSDYIKVGLPLTLVVFVITMLALPLVWPLQ